MKEINDIPDNMILNVTMPVGVPLLYQFDSNLQAIGRDGVHSPSASSAVYLDGGKKDHLVSALENYNNWRMQFDAGPSRRTLNAATTVERALWQLRQDEQLASQLYHHTESGFDNFEQGERWVDDPIEAEDFEFFSESDGTMNDQSFSNLSIPNVLPVPSTKHVPASDPVVVFVRHGRTPHNNMGLFTGFQDPQ
jgi:hypothetical protein